MSIFDIAIGGAVIATTYLGYQLALIGLVAWHWPWWAILGSTFIGTLGLTIWIGAVKDSNREAPR
jgi:hypothetical protein